jgi:putative flippase GtrA
MSAQPLRFLGVGICGYGVNLAAFAVLYGTGARYALAAVLAYLGSNAFMYLGNRYFTFKLGHEGFWAAYGRYLLVGCVVAALAASVLAGLVEVARLEPRFGQPLALLIVAPLAFALFKRVSFRLS